MSSRMVCFIFSDIRNPVYSAMIKGAEDVLSAHDYLLIVASSDGSSERELALLELFKRRGADGVIFSVFDETDPAVLASVATGNLPVVLIEREMAAPVNAVGADHIHGVKRACDYLIGLGHRRIALITGGQGNRVARDRLLGLQQAHDNAGIPVDPRLLKLTSFATEYAFRETQMLLGMAEPPTAIMALGMQLLPGVLPALRMRDLSVPDDISIIASGDSPLAELATPAITVLRYDAYALGCEAARLLLRQLNGEVVPDGTRISVPTELVLRQSCSAPGKKPG